MPVDQKEIEWVLGAEIEHSTPPLGESSQRRRDAMVEALRRARAFPALLAASEGVLHLNDHVGLECDNGVWVNGQSEGCYWLSQAIRALRAAVDTAKETEPAP